MLGISKYDRAETARWLDKNDWTFPLLCDGRPAIEGYGLTNPDVTREEHKGIPYPATIIIDKKGIVRFLNIWVNYKVRTPPATILEELKKLS